MTKSRIGQWNAVVFTFGFDGPHTGGSSHSLPFWRRRYGPTMTTDCRPKLVRSYERHLRAENCSKHTIDSYRESLRQAEAFLAARGLSLWLPAARTWRPSLAICSK
jgi:hypothetical protein